MDYLPFVPNYAVFRQKNILIKNIKRKQKIQDLIRQQTNNHVDTEEKIKYETFLKSELMSSINIIDNSNGKEIETDINDTTPSFLKEAVKKALSKESYFGPKNNLNFFKSSNIFYPREEISNIRSNKQIEESEINFSNTSALNYLYNSVPQLSVNSPESLMNNIFEKNNIY